MKIKLIWAVLIEGVHHAEEEVVEVAEDLGRYLIGSGAAKKAAGTKAAKADEKPAEPAKTAAKGAKQK